jgi:hypothetical protein
MPQSHDAEKCPRCRSGPEYYWYLGLYEFDVDRARAFAADGRTPVEVEEESVRVSIRSSKMHEPHIDHVDTRYPGVIAHVHYQEESGLVHRCHLLIDGHHRAARCLREGRPFHAYLLTEEESQAILIRSPEMTKRNSEPAETPSPA